MPQQGSSFPFFFLFLLSSWLACPFDDQIFVWFVVVVLFTFPIIDLAWLSCLLDVIELPAGLVFSFGL
jgi:hypothetical protein